MKAILVSIFGLMLALAGWGQTAPLPKGNVTSVTQNACGSGFVSGATCYQAVVSCPNTANLGVNFGYNNPQPQKASVVFFSGGDGTVPAGQEYEKAFTPAGIQIIQVTWVSRWEDTGLPAKNILTAACRGATIGQYIHDQVHKVGKFGAHGFSAGSGLVGYWLGWYDGGSVLNSVELVSGPVFSDLQQGCEVPQAPKVAITGYPGQTWTDQVWYSQPRATITLLTGYTCQPTTPTPPSSNAGWLTQSIVHPGVVLSFATTTVSQWLCTNGQNNSAAQGYLFTRAVTSQHSTMGIKNCSGAEGVSTGVTPSGVSGLNAVTQDVIKQLTQ